MATEVRIYTVKPGKLDEFVSIFVAEIMPTSAKYGVRVHAAWRNDEANEFVWVRSYDDEQALSTYSNSPERALYSFEIPRLPRTDAGADGRIRHRTAARRQRGSVAEVL